MIPHKQWDLNTGQKVRTFSHGSQLSAIAMRSISGPYVPEPTDRVMFSAAQDAGSSYLTGESITTESNLRDIIGLGRDGDISATTKPAEVEIEAKSEASYDPLFDEPETESGGQQGQSPQHEEQPLLITKEESASSLSLPKPNDGSAVPKLPVVQAGLVPLSKKTVIPLLDPVTYSEYSTDVLLAASIDGQVVLWDRRAGNNRGVGRLEMSERCPPWCLSVLFVLLIFPYVWVQFPTGMLVI